MNTVLRPTRADIDLGALVRNARRVRERASGARLWAVVKADAYGHGAVPVARALVPHVHGLAVSLVEEGVELRDSGITVPVLVLGGSYANHHAVVLHHDLTPVVFRTEDVVAFGTLAAERGRPCALHLKLDTGMSRLGVRWDETAAFLGAVSGVSGVRFEGVCTHLACADLPVDDMSAVQLARFDEALAIVGRHGIRSPMLHAANSAAAARYPQARLDAVRPGLALYGGGPRDDLGLEPVMRLRTEVFALKDIRAGDVVSYGALWRAQGPTRLAILPVGYADGVSRHFTGRGQILIGGVRCPIVGAVTMDMTLVDVTALGDGVKPGAEAVLLGAQGDDELRASELAAWSGTIEYEVLCSVSRRVPRAYLGAADATATIG